MSYPKHVDFLIIGAGAAGLFMANELIRKGFSVMLAEQRVRATTHSKSIGIHPPSLRLLENLGLLDEFLKSGISVTEGLAFVRPKSIRAETSLQKPIGSIKLGSGQGTDRILVVPQHKTEAILSENLPEGVLFRGLKLIDFSDETERGSSEVQNDSGFPVEAFFEVNPEVATGQSTKSEKPSSLSVNRYDGEARSENKEINESSDSSIKTGNSGNPENTSGIG
ncbi:MAG: FAD-dependent monooxygenase, partial [Balneolales bacterium]|nr:FAD-dependent monooxygenase [Balneolales bacterium]